MKALTIAIQSPHSLRERYMQLFPTDSIGLSKNYVGFFSLNILDLRFAIHSRIN